MPVSRAFCAPNLHERTGTLTCARRCELADDRHRREHERPAISLGGPRHPARTVDAMPDDAVRAVAELAASQHGAFTRRQAAANGFSRARVATALRNGWLVERPPGVLAVTGHPDTWEQRLTLATLAGGGHGVASHRSAARLHGLDGFDRDAHVEVTVDNRHRLRLPADIGATIHHVDRLRVRARRRRASRQSAPPDWPGLSPTSDRCAPPARCGEHSTDARRRGSSIQWIRQTAQRCHRRGQAGTGRLLRLLDAIPHEGGVPESWFEELLAECLADPAIPPVVTQYRILDRAWRVRGQGRPGDPVRAARHRGPQSAIPLRPRRRAARRATRSRRSGRRMGVALPRLARREAPERGPRDHPPRRRRPEV